MNRLPLAELQALFRKSPAFKRVFLADATTQFGDGGLLIAFPMLIMARTNDVTLTGLAFSGEILAFGLLSPVAGMLADRLEQKTLMLAANLARVALFMALLVAYWLNAPIAVFMALSVALGAAGALEAVICALALQEGSMPAGLNTRAVDPRLGVRYLLENRRGRLARVMSNSFGFGGSNCSLVLGRAG